MNYSEHEHSTVDVDTEDEALVEAAVKLLPPLGPALYGAITGLAQRHHLTPTQVKVMLQLGAHGQMTIGEIACRLHASMPATSEMVDRLVEAGHLLRASDPADRRRVLITASAGSRRLLEELNTLRRAQVRAALDQLAPEERPLLVRALEALVAGLAVGAEPGPVAGSSVPNGASRPAAASATAVASRPCAAADSGRSH